MITPTSRNGKMIDSRLTNQLVCGTSSSNLASLDVIASTTSAPRGAT